MKKKTNSFYSYSLLSLIVLYALKGSLYPTGVLSIIITALELGICFLLGIKVLLFKHRSNVANTLYFIIVLVSICYIVSDKEVYIIKYGILSSFTFFREFCGSVLPFFAMYYLARKHQVTVKLLNIFFIAVFIAFVIEFFYETFTIMALKDKEYITSNSSYRFVYIMPFVPLIKGRTKILVFWIISISLAILSTKRGAILGLCLECILYYCWQLKNTKNRISFIIGALIIGSIGWHYLYIYYWDNPYLQIRLENTLAGGSSGRNYMISTLLYYYSNTNLIQMIFGSGFAHCANIAGDYAHNDWIELLIDCGGIGFFLCLMFYYQLFQVSIRLQGQYKKILILIIIAFLPSSFYSMVFFSESVSIGFLWLGFVIGCYDAKRYDLQLVS